MEEALETELCIQRFIVIVTGNPCKEHGISPFRMYQALSAFVALLNTLKSVGFLFTTRLLAFPVACNMLPFDGMSATTRCVPKQCKLLLCTGRYHVALLLVCLYPVVGFTAVAI